MICPRCKKESSPDSQFCNYCGLKFSDIGNSRPVYNAPIKPKKNAKGCLLIFAIVIIGIVVIAAISSNKKEATTAATSANTAQQQSATTEEIKVGINPDTFHKTVMEKIKAINTNNLIGKIETEVYGSTGFVKLYLADLSSWSYTSDVEKKEFMNTFGNLMDSIASGTVYPGTESIATSTILYSPGEMELAERTIWGNVKLK